MNLDKPHQRYLQYHYETYETIALSNLADFQVLVYRITNLC